MAVDDQTIDDCPMRSFSEFDAALGADDLQRAEEARLRSLAIWGYLLLRPGMEFVRQRSNFILGWQAAAGGSLADGASAGAVGRAGVPPLGSWMILPELTSPATQTVLPSNDALYGAAHVELDLLGPMVVSVPANVDDRYFSVSIMDAHMNNVDHIGPRWTGNDAVDVLIVPPDWTGVGPDGMRLVTSPTPSLCLYNRMLVRFEDGDLDRVRRWQAGLRLTQLSHWGEPDPVLDDVPTDAFVHPELNTTTDDLLYLRIGRDHLERNPMDRSAGWLAALVSGAGFDAAAGDQDLRRAVEAGVDDATRMLDASLTTWPRDGGWMVPDPRLGLPNADVQRSAAYQQFQIGSNDVAEATYSFTDTDADGRVLDASGGAIYELSFGPGETPSVEPSGYWSVTMYNEHSLLVDNPIHRYATRPDRPGLVHDADGRLTFVLATELPAGVPEANWLPAPSGRFRLGLRVYYPSPLLVADRWSPPPVTRRP
jgi:hypothetical protein